MTFKHKLSVRLALLKDVLPLMPLLGLLAACERASMLAPPIKTNINVSTIVTVPASVNLDPGQSKQFASYGRTPAGDSVDINVTWQAVGGGLISASGLYTAGTLQGDYAVKATLIPPAAIGAPVTAVPMRTSVVHVDPVAQIVVAPASTSVVTGGTQQFAAYGRRGAGDSVALSVVWSATGGTISSSGLYTAGATPGGYVVNASADGLTGTATVTASSVPVASIVVSPASVSVSVGSTLQLTALAKDAGGSALPGRTVTWTTSSSAVATVSPSGLVSGVAVGSATITATSEGKSATAAVSVTNLPVASVTVSPSPASVYVGATARLVATLKDANGNPLSGRAVAWTTSNGAVASVDSTGLVTGIALGTTIITATSEGQAGSATVTVSSVPVASVLVAPSAANMLVGDTVRLTATTQDAAGTVLAGRAITWSSSNPSVVTVSSTGLATGASAGTATITATSEGKNASATVTVANVPVASVVITPATALVLVGASVQLVASPKDAAGNVLSGRAITWTSSASATATVTSTGLVTGVGAGAVTITAMSEGMTGSAAVTVNPVPVASVSLSPATVSVAVGQAVQLTATPRDANGNPLSGRVVTWATSNAAVATVTSSGQVTVGVVTGVAAGSATITATSEGKIASSTATVTLVPVASVAVTPAAATITGGSNLQLSAVTRDAAGNTLTGRVVTWSSSNTSVATVSGSGLIVGQSAGSATITATSESAGGTSAITVQTPPPGSRVGYYVAPGGSSSGDGSASKPWDLTTAFNGGGGRVQPGDTIWLRGGTYLGKLFFVNTNGTPGNLITFRQYPGERATLNGEVDLRGNYTALQGFEILNTTNSVDVNAFWNGGTGNKAINMVLHDALGQGVAEYDPGAHQSEIYGCIVYNNGQHFVNDHGMYIKNDAAFGRKYILDNVVFNNWSFGIHVYGEPPQHTEDVTEVGNVSFNNGSIGDATRYDFDYLIGGLVPVRGIVFTGNYQYRQGGLGGAADFGYHAGQPNGDITVGNNYFAGGQVALQTWATATVTGNAMYGAGASVNGSTSIVNLQGSTSGYTMSGNTAYGDPTAPSWTYNATQTTFGNWTTLTGLTNAGAYAGTAPTGLLVAVRPNKYEPGRANIIVYNWAQQSTVSVNVSTILKLGDHYVVQNVQDFYGTPVATGTYDGSTLQLPTGGVAPPALLGRSPATSPPVTGPTFNVFVLMKTP
jgi:uncharacterized protein YjdB